MLEASYNKKKNPKIKKNPVTAKQDSQQHLNSASAYCAKCKNELAKGYFFQREKKKTLLHSLFFFFLTNTRILSTHSNTSSCRFTPYFIKPRYFSWEFPFCSFTICMFSPGGFAITENFYYQAEMPAVCFSTFRYAAAVSNKPQ